MGSKTNADSTESEYNPSDSPSPPKRPPRQKSIPQRLKVGIDKRIPGVPSTFSQPSPNPKAKSVSFKEPSETPKKRKIDPAEAKEKRKQKVSEPEPPAKRKKTTMGDSSHKQGTSSDLYPSDDPDNIIPDAVKDISDRLAVPKGRNFLVTPAEVDPEHAKKFWDQFSKKSFCSVVSVNLEKLKTQFNCDLTPWLGQFESLLAISAPYTPNIVKLFYYNMTSSNEEDANGDTIEYGFTTKVRGRSFRVTPALINKILQIENPLPVPTIHYSNQQAFAILRPGEPFPADQSEQLSFKPTSMPPLHRVLWYIVCRNLLQKGGAYTHFATDDYKLFAAILDKTPINVGYWLHSQMTRFRFGSRISSHVPFASLVSVILYYHRIWHLSSSQASIVHIPTFGKSQLNLMKISFDEGSAQSKAPSKPSQAPSSKAPREEEVHSQPSAPPTDFEDKVKSIVNTALHALTEVLDSEFRKLIASASRTSNDILDTQAHIMASVGTLLVASNQQDTKLQQLASKVDSLESKVDKLLQRTSTNAFGSEFDGSAGPSFTHPSPGPSVIPTAEVIPTDEQLLSTAGPLVLYHPPSPLAPAFPEDPSFEDDKGGESNE